MDSAFPASGFAHSAGLEAAWQQGWVGTSEEVVRFTAHSLRQTARLALPFVNELYAASRPIADLATLVWTLCSPITSPTAPAA